MTYDYVNDDQQLGFPPTAEKHKDFPASSKSKGGLCV